ncbi:MAG: transketolase C-terminal domain-containing protein, partial [Minisyncoccales bacterium]
HIGKELPEIYVHGGIMERNNFSVAAGFGSEKNKQGIFGTFAAFSEMVISEVTMARLNKSNVLAHFSHSGVDDMADNTCHFGINNFFVDNGLSEEQENDNTKLYFPADELQLKAILKKVFWEKGLRFLFTTRSAVPFILDNDGKKFFDKNNNYEFSGNDEIIRTGKKGYIISYGEMLYRSLDAVENLKKESIDIGLINKPLLNVPDKEMLKKLKDSELIVVVESQNQKTGLGIRYGTWLLEQGFKGKYLHLGSTKEGAGGLSEQIPFQGLDSKDIIEKVKEMIKN